MAAQKNCRKSGGSLSAKVFKECIGANNMSVKKLKIIPNCKTCAWDCIQKVCDGLNIANCHFCGAQGYNSTIDCYNNKLCRKLFKIKVNKNAK